MFHLYPPLPVSNREYVIGVFQRIHKMSLNTEYLKHGIYRIYENKVYEIFNVCVRMLSDWICYGLLRKLMSYNRKL